MCWYFQWTYEECGHTVSDKTNRCVERNKGNKCGPEGDQLDPWPENRKGVCPECQQDDEEEAIRRREEAKAEQRRKAEEEANNKRQRQHEALKQTGYSLQQHANDISKPFLQQNSNADTSPARFSQFESNIPNSERERRDPVMDSRETGVSGVLNKDTQQQSQSGQFSSPVSPPATSSARYFALGPKYPAVQVPEYGYPYSQPSAGHPTGWMECNGVRYLPHAGPPIQAVPITPPCTPVLASNGVFCPSAPQAIRIQTPYGYSEVSYGPLRACGNYHR